MTLASYHIRHDGKDWCVTYNDGSESVPYATREAAFENAVGDASNAIKSGYAVEIRIDQPRANESTLGTS